MIIATGKKQYGCYQKDEPRRSTPPVNLYFSYALREKRREPLSL
jgi:hypothetical protein